MVKDPNIFNPDEPLTDDDPVPATDEFEKVRANLGTVVRRIDLTTGGAEGDLGGAATAGAQGTIEGAGDWEGSNLHVPGTEFPDDGDTRGRPDELRILQPRLGHRRLPISDSKEDSPQRRR